MAEGNYQQVEQYLVASRAQEVTERLRASVESIVTLLPEALERQYWKYARHAGGSGYENEAAYVADIFGGLRHMRLSAEQRDVLVEALSDQGWSVRAIAEKTGVSKSTVARALRVVQEIPTNEIGTVPSGTVPSGEVGNEAVATSESGADPVVFGPDPLRTLPPGEDVSAEELLGESEDEPDPFAPEQEPVAGTVVGSQYGPPEPRTPEQVEAGEMRCWDRNIGYFRIDIQQAAKYALGVPGSWRLLFRAEHHERDKALVELLESVRSCALGWREAAESAISYAVQAGLISQEQAADWLEAADEQDEPEQEGSE